MRGVCPNPRNLFPWNRNRSTRLFEEGVFASAICFPMVPKGTARVRVIVSASFSREDCDAGLAAFKKVAAEFEA